MTDIERRFGEAMFAIYREARDIGYTPSIFLRMLHEKGPLQTARQLINASQPSDGYTRPLGPEAAGFECRSGRSR